MSDPTEGEKPDRRWHRLWRQPHKWYLLWIPAGGVLMFVAGIIVWGGFNTAIEATNTEGFCISCHEMREYVYQEYQETSHYKNRTGVRATCPDCHVPRPWIYKMARKVRATLKELPRKIIGTVNTREKFEARRLELAEYVWRTMKSTDSRECRNCHALMFMDLEKQDKSARKKHAMDFVRESGKTCIDCHKGVAHSLPRGYE
ncbi:MAG: NapC/NirT family cytochrome c [Nitrospirae bacterium]|nr:NapC/NirT family cytochrome c [Nitrospirota bacterium]MBI3605104.1 NapC/NirT family cytochrome c [Nitrospirota bacterium]